MTLENARTQVVEIGPGLAAGMAGWLFAAAGADVARAPDPAPPARPLDRRRQEHLARGKRALGPDEVAGAVATADVVIAHGGPVPEVATGAVVVDVSTFGRAGTRAGSLGGELCAQASGGYAALCGSADGPPTRLVGAPFERLTGVAAYIWALAALRARSVSGTAARIDLAVEDTVAANLEYAPALYAWMGLRKRRGVTYPFAYPHDLYAAADGYLELTLATREPLLMLGLAIDVPELGAVEGFDTEYRRAIRNVDFDALVGPLLQDVTRRDFFDRTTELRMPTGYVTAPGEIEELPPVVDRRALDDGPCSPLTPVDRRGMEPRPMAPPPAPMPPPAPPAGGGPVAPLAGVRVLDLTVFYAGSTATRILAELGATVVRVTSIQSPGRGLGLGMIADYRPGEDPWNASCYYYERLAGKQEVTLDLSTAAGADLFHRMLDDSDVFVTNLSPRALVHLGLDEPTLRAAHPGLVMSQISGYGSTGPWKDLPAVGPGVEALAGIAWTNGAADGPPSLPGTAIADAIAGYWGAAGVLQLLAERDRTGEGGLADVSMLEGCLAVFPEPLLEPAAFAERPRCGNDDGAGLVAGIFAGAGDDRWLAVEVADVEGWRALAAVLGIAGEPGEDRAARHERVAAAVRAHGAGAPEELEELEELEAALRAVGVAAAVVRDARDVLVDGHRWARGALEVVEQPGRGRRPMARQLPGVTAELRCGIGGRAPTLGEHNREVLGGRLGVAPEELDRLAAAGVIGTVPSASWDGVEIIEPVGAEAAGLTSAVDPSYRVVSEGAGRPPRPGRRASTA